MPDCEKILLFLKQRRKLIIYVKDYFYGQRRELLNREEISTQKRIDYPLAPSLTYVVVLFLI